LGFLLVVAAAAIWVVKRGSRRQGLLDRAVAALKAGDRRGAEAALREIVAADPSNAPARGQLVQILIEDGRLDDAEALAKEWAERPDGRVTGTRFLVDIALRRAQVHEAERLARSVADVDPRFAQATFLLMREVVGDPVSLWDAQSIAVNLAAFARNGAERAELYLVAADALTDLRPNLPASAHPALDAQVARYVAEAGNALRASPTPGKSSKLLSARVQLLSDSAAVREVGARELDAFVRENPGDLPALAAQVTHLSRDAKWAEVEAPMAKLRDGPPAMWIRSARRVAAAGRRDLAIRMLGEGTQAEHPIAMLTRSGFLLVGDEREQTSGVEQLSRLLERTSFAPPLTLQVAAMLHAAKRPEDLVELLSKASAASPDVRVEARLAAALAARGEAGDRERAETLVGGIPARIATVEEAVDVVGALRPAGEPMLRRLGAASVGTGSEGERRRMYRAAAYAARATARSDEADVLKELAVADATALIDSSLAKADMSRLGLLALSLGQPQLAGRYVVRTVAMSGPTYELPLLCLAMAERTPDVALRAAFGKGLREPDVSGAPGPFLVALADAVEHGSLRAPGLLPALERAAADETSRIPSLFLSSRVALLTGDTARAESDARRLVEALPDSSAAREALADALLAGKRFPEVLTSYAGHDDKSFASHRHRVIALLATGKKDEALAQARSAVRDHPEAEEAYLQLASVHEAAGRVDEALGVLNVSPASRAVDLRRAMLLVQKQELTAAKIIYSSLVTRGPRDIEAWRGLAHVSLGGASDGPAEMLARLDRVLSSRDLDPKDPARAEFLVLKGMANEEASRFSEALRDYEAALAIAPEHVTALNNAAWLLLQHDRSRLADARAYVERAVTSAADHPNVRDTAAGVYAALGERELALANIEKALALLKKPAYMMTRAKLLRDASRSADARTQLLELIAQFPESREAVQARTDLRELGG
jgi:tetratricopeptide (TPR) repeat protein